MKKRDKIEILIVTVYFKEYFCKNYRLQIRINLQSVYLHKFIYKENNFSVNSSNKSNRVSRFTCERHWRAHTKGPHPHRSRGVSGIEI